jgi:hypothetical protein
MQHENTYKYGYTSNLKRRINQYNLTDGYFLCPREIHEKENKNNNVFKEDCIKKNRVFKKLNWQYVYTKDCKGYPAKAAESYIQAEIQCEFDPFLLKHKDCGYNLVRPEWEYRTMFFENDLHFTSFIKETLESFLKSYKTRKEFLRQCVNKKYELE